MTTIKETSGTSLTEEVVELTVEETGASGILPALDRLDEKAVVVAADLTITGDSADSFANKKSTWQQIIDSVLSVFILKTDLDNVTNDAQLKRSAGDFQAFTQKINIDGTESLISEDGSDGENKKRITVDGIKDFFQTAFNLIYAILSDIQAHGLIDTSETFNSLTKSEHTASADSDADITLVLTTARPDMYIVINITTICTLSLVGAGITYTFPLNQTANLTDLAVGLWRIIPKTTDNGANVVVSVQQVT